MLLVTIFTAIANAISCTLKNLPTLDMSYTVYICDEGLEIWQLNNRSTSGRVR